MNINKIEEIKTLITKLNKYAYDYYVLDNPTTSDKQYDIDYIKLETLESETGYIDLNSPTQRVGDITLSKFEKIKHRTHLWSLDKAQTKEEVENFIYRCNKFVRQYNLSYKEKLPNPEYIVTKKFDGLTLNSSYDNGSLTKSASRGTGEIGENITFQSKTILNLPKSINSKNSIDVHGECLMTKNAFKQYNDNLKLNETPLKNLRNGAAGALRNLNIKEAARRKLVTQIYDLSYSEQQFDNYTDTLAFMKSEGFTVAEYEICNNFDEVSNAIDKIGKERDNLQYDIDGVVITVNHMRTRELMGVTNKFPKHSIAFKFETTEIMTQLLDVEFRTGRTGKITPRATVSPVLLMGATVNYATLNSMDDIKRKGVKIGSDVFIRRSNDVIPEILGVVEDSLTDDMIDIEMVKTCQSCGSILIQDGVHFFCRNSLNCKPQIVKGISQYGSLEAMNIDGFSEQTAELFIDNGIIKSVLDLYDLETKKRIIMDLPKFGLKKYNNLIKSIENSKKCNVNQFLYALGIDGIGRKASKDICKYFNNDIDKIINAKAYDLLKIEGVGDKTVKSYSNYFANESDRKLVLDLVKILDFEKEEIKTMSKVKENLLLGKHVYPTGVFGLKKADLKVRLESIGAIVENGYKKSLDYLICGNDMSKSGKGDKAKADHVKIMTENEMIDIMN